MNCCRLKSFFILASFVVLSSCRISGVCIDKKECTKTDPPSGSSGTNTPASADSCSGAGDLLGKWRSGDETLSFDKNCQFSSARCSASGTFTLTRAKSAALFLQTEEEVEALVAEDGGVRYLFNVNVTKATAQTHKNKATCPLQTGNYVCEYYIYSNDKHRLHLDSCKLNNLSFFGANYDRTN